MDAETRQARLPAVELPADPQSPVYSAPAYSADSAPPSRPPVAVTAGARARGASLSASNAPLTDSETSADRRPSHAPPYSLDPDCPPSFLDAEFDSSLPPAYAPRTAPQAAVGRAAHPSVPPEAAKTVQSQSLAQIFATMKYPVETRTGWLYHSLVLDMLFAVLVGVSTLGYSLLGTAWIQYSGTKGDPAGEAYLALWGVCVSNSTSTLKCGFTWATDAYRGYFSSAMIVAVPSLASFSWFAVMTVAFMSAGLLHDLWACWINVLGTFTGLFMWLVVFPLTTWFMNSAYRAFEPYSTSRYMPGFYLGLVSLILAIASMCLKIISLRYKVKSVHSATVDVELENANDGSAQGSGNRRDSGGSG